MPSWTSPSSRSTPVRRANASPGGGVAEPLVDAEAHAVGRGFGALRPLARAEREVARPRSRRRRFGQSCSRPRSGRAAVRGWWRARGAGPPTRRAGSRSRAPATPVGVGSSGFACTAAPASARCRARRRAPRPGAPSHATEQTRPAHARQRTAGRGHEDRRSPSLITWSRDSTGAGRSPGRDRRRAAQDGAARASAGRASAIRSASALLFFTQVFAAAPAHARRVRHVFTRGQHLLDRRADLPARAAALDAAPRVGRAQPAPRRWRAQRDRVGVRARHAAPRSSSRVLIGVPARRGSPRGAVLRDRRRRAGGAHRDPHRPPDPREPRAGGAAGVPRLLPR